MTLWENATFPDQIRMGQSVLLKKDYVYSVVVWARVNRGTEINGRDGAIVSTFCEPQNRTGFFVGKDSTLNAVESFEKTDYSRVQYNIVGDGSIWICYIGLLGQPTDIPKEVTMYIDDFRVWEMSEITPPMGVQNALQDGSFDEGLSEVERTENGWEFNGDTPWHINYSRRYNTTKPFIGTNGRLCMNLAADRNVLEFLGVIQQVDLQMGQKYELQIDYTRKEPAILPPGVDVSIFNYYVRLPDDGSRLDQPHVRHTEGMLFGQVDVRVFPNEPNGTSSVIIVAPKTATYEVVLKMSAYGNQNLGGAYEMTFDNACLMPINE